MDGGVPVVTVTLEEGVAQVTLAHPPLNIVTRDVMRALREALDRLAEEPSVRVLLFRAEGKHFSAGADVGEHLPPDYRDMIPEFVATVSAIASFPLPVVAAVQGRCLGGAFELIQAADIVIAARGASFGQPEIHLGVYPPAACVALPRRCLPSAAAELLYTGDPIDADEAMRVGVVGRVVDDGTLEAAALELAGRIARHSGAALRLTKRTARTHDEADWTAAVAAAGRAYVEELMATRDAEEGLRAFMEKRRPAWSDR